MNILITGACGHIGSYLADNIYKIKKVKKVYLVDDLKNGRINTLFNSIKKNKLKFYLCDISIQNSLNFLKNIDVVIHLASLTNAAGSAIKESPPGSVMLITDHINMTGISPLIGADGNERFVNMVNAYDPKLNNDMREAAKANNINLHEGVYAWFSGPQFETPAEIRAVSILGADAVGMSTVPEVILARHQGMPVCALSVITNYAAGMSETDISHEQTIAYASKAADTVEKLLNSYLKNY